MLSCYLNRSLPWCEYVYKLKEMIANHCIAVLTANIVTLVMNNVQCVDKKK